ncbi:MAG: hypothetical protein B6I29_04350 [Marinitoga sp. 4572_148]|nr:MAG: hypothetical protein B6I29_04350 [Marinitoga sp. 4572_148]
MLSKEDIKELKKFAIQIRIETLKEIGHLGFGHLPGAMSIVELLAVLYGKIMKINPQNPKWEERDWFILSKGHAGPSLYATLALKGYFPKDWLLTLNKGGTLLPSHTDKNLTPGIDMTTGSLGQGMSTALGVALGHKTIKGKGVSFLEGKVAHHVKVKQSEIEEAIEKLEKELETLEEGEL